LVVDDDPGIGDLIVQAAEGLGFLTATVERSSQIVEMVRSFEPDLIVLDLMMPGADGVQVLRSLADEKCVAEIILFSGADARVLNTAARLGASHGLRIRELLHKPIALAELEAALAQFNRAAPSDPEAELRTAISNRDICVHYQPKVTLTGGETWSVTGIEALARWPHPLRGMIPPSEFIPLAERTGLIGDLTDLVIEQAIRQAGVLREGGHVIEVAANLSPLTLADPEMPDRLSQMLAEHRVENSQFVIEITESAAMADGTLTMENMTRFRLKGMKLSMDDFGTGYSSLVQLYRMPFSELKIDRSFVMDLNFKEEARAVVRSIVDLAHNLNLTVCAEGVETTGALNFLRSIGCDQAQGYHISKPLDETGLARFLESDAANRTAAIAAAPSGR
jgi:EAL domain-containing protein (putative c-di-GMP-specific phosphodiesterase class I)